MTQILGIAINLLAGDASWYNYPGWEAWKFLNLFLFLGVLFYFLRRPLSESLVARRESIRRELMRAREERDAALVKLEEVEARLSRLDAEVEAVRAQSQREAADEKERIARATEEEMRKLREQAQREIESAGKVARQELRRYAAEQSALLAEELIRRDMRAEDDARLMKDYVEELGGVRR
jgi:F0F1-type ATP synthase membrane subunit b/b'